MKKFLSILLAVLMVFSSTVSYAAPSLAGSTETAVEYYVPVIEEQEESAEATLAAVDTTEYGELVVRFTYDNLTADTDYLSAFTVTDYNNDLVDVGGEWGSGSHMNTNSNNTRPFAWDGANGSSERHSAVYAREESDGNVYLELQGTGSTARFGIRDYNGGGFAKAGHYILTVDVLSETNKRPFNKAHF